MNAGIKIYIKTLIAQFILFTVFIIGLLLNINININTHAQSDFDPCSVYSSLCLGGVTNNNRYTSGGAGERAQRILIDLANFLTFVCASVAILFVIFYGFNMLSAQGDSKKFEDARRGILYAIFGLVTVVLAYGITGAIVNIITGIRL
jgi:Type IV secretion system pilin